MSLQLTSVLDDSENFIFDSNKIYFNGSNARLKLNLFDEDFTQLFVSDTGITYDSDLVEFTGSKAQQKDSRPSNATFGASFTGDVNGSWGDGTLTGTAYNGASVLNGKLDLSGSTNKYIDYDADKNADSQQTGCIRFKWTPKYSGAGSFQYLVTLVEGPALSNNRIRIYHQSTLLFVAISNSVGGSIVSVAEAFSPIADTEYEIELNWDITAGATRLFVDGTQLGSTQTGTGTRDANIGLMRLGKDLNGNGNANFLIDDLIIFSTVQHTSNYVAGYSVPNYIYLEASMTLPEMEKTGNGTINDFNELITTESGNVRYTLQIGRSGNYLYWDGSAWSTSDGTYAQATSKSTWNANVDSLPVSGEIYGQFKVHFGGSNSTLSSITSLTADMQVYLYPTTNPTIELSTTIGIEELINFAHSASITGSDNIKYVLKKDNTWYYHNGSSWTVSDETYSQSNTIAEIVAAVSTFTTDGVSFKWKAFLHSGNSLTTPILTSVTVIYDFYGVYEDVDTCIVWGSIKDLEGNQNVSTFTVTLNQSAVKYKSQVMIRRKTITVTPDSDGYWEVDLVDNTNMEGNPKYVFDFGENRIFERTVPNAVSRNWFQLV